MQARQAASALNWWQEAGVDTLVAEAPRNWLKPAPAPPVMNDAAAPAPAMFPDTLDAFRSWLSTAPLPFAAAHAPRLAPAGDPHKGLMIMTAMPALDGGWFEGVAGPLFDRMLEAMRGLGRAAVYLAPFCPVRMPHGLDPAHQRLLADIARHHAGLARPRALILFGDLCADALLGAGVAATRGRWHALDTPGGPVKTIATLRPEQLVDRPNLKKFVWEDLQRVMEELP